MARRLGELLKQHGIQTSVKVPERHFYTLHGHDFVLMKLLNISDGSLADVLPNALRSLLTAVTEFNGDFTLCDTAAFAPLHDGKVAVTEVSDQCCGEAYSLLKARDNDPDAWNRTMTGWRVQGEQDRAFYLKVFGMYEAGLRTKAQKALCNKLVIDSLGRLQGSVGEGLNAMIVKRLAIRTQAKTTWEFTNFY